MKTKHYIAALTLTVTAFFTSCSSLKTVGENKSLYFDITSFFGKDF